MKYPPFVSSNRGQGWLNLLRPEGPLRPGFRVESSDLGSYSIVVNSAGGADARGYGVQLEALLSRLGTMRSTILRIEVESTATFDLEIGQRILGIPFPIRPGKDHDPSALRQQISSAQRPIGQKQGTRGGNGNRRIRIHVDSGEVETSDFLRGLQLTQDLPDLTDVASDSREADDDVVEREIASRTFDGPVDRLQLIRAKRGQGAFRSNVLAVEQRCRVTGVSDVRLLRASHIKPWRISDDSEKIDGNNGLMLSPHVDALFDKGFITFEKTGRLRASSQVDLTVLQLWSISTDHHYGDFSNAQSNYLAHHHEEVFLG